MNVIKILPYLVLFFMVGCSSLTNSHRIETEYGHFTYYLSGNRKPTVVFESGLGDDMTSWKKVIEKVEEHSEVFAYNRAGFSGSSSKNEIRNGQVVVTELRELLKQADVKPPYVLVGHSLGGAYMELYAKTYPDEVAGVVFVDPNSSKFPAVCKQQKLERCDPPSSMPKWATFIYPSALEGEIKGFRTTHKQINANDSFPDVPLVVLSATNKMTKATKKQQQANDLYTQMQRELTNYSSTSKFIGCDSCSHDI